MSHYLSHRQRDFAETSRLTIPLLLVNDVVGGVISRLQPDITVSTSPFISSSQNLIPAKICPDRESSVALPQITSDAGESPSVRDEKNTCFTTECYVYSVFQKPRFSAADRRAGNIAMPFIGDLVTPI